MDYPLTVVVVIPWVILRACIMKRNHVVQLLLVFGVDEDGDGVITHDEIGRVFRVLNPKMPQDPPHSLQHSALTPQSSFM